MAENDALVELIQTTEYLEDTPMWGHRDYWFYPLGMVTLFKEEEEGAEEEVGKEENGWVRLFEREAIQGFVRGSSHGIGRGNGRGFYSQAPLERNQ